MIIFIYTYIHTEIQLENSMKFSPQNNILSYLYKEDLLRVAVPTAS